MEVASSVGFTRLLTLCGSDGFVSLLAFEWSPETDWGHYVGGEWPFLGYNFETEAFSDVVDTRALKHPEEGGEVVLEVPCREVVWLQETSYASFESCELEWKPLNGEIDEEEGPDDNGPDTDLLELLLHFDAGWTQDVGVFEPGVANAWGKLEAELTRARLAVPATVEKV